MAKHNFITKIIDQAFPLFLSAPVIMWQVLFFFIPIIFIVALSIMSCDPMDMLCTSFTFKHIMSFAKLAYVRVIARSLLLALTNACICLLISYPMAYFLAFKAGKFKNILLFLLIVPFWTNFLLHIYAWFFVLERGGFLNTVLIYLGIIDTPLHILNSMFAVNIMMVYYYFPFMALPLYSVLEKFDRRLIEASLDLGASWWQTLRKIVIPLTLTGILSGFFLVFVPSFAEFAIPELMGGDKKMFVGTVVSHYILGGTTISQGAAFTLLSSAVLIVSAIIIYYAIKRILKAI